MSENNKRRLSQLGILLDSQYCQGPWIDEETGDLVVSQIVDCSASWPLDNLESDICAGQQQAKEEAEQRDFEVLLQIIAVAKDHIGKSADKDAAQELVYLGIEIGQLLARIEVRPDRKSIHVGRAIRKVNADKARRTAKLTPAQWREVKKHIRAETQRGVSAAQVCRKVAAQLSNGQFDKLPTVHITISPRTLQQRWTDRNKNN